jgi:hypothetical protein
MTLQAPDLVELVRAALARAEAEGFLQAEDQARLQAVFEAVVAEIQGYRAQMRQVAGAVQEQAIQKLTQASRFVSPKALGQIRSRLARPQAVQAESVALFHGLAPEARKPDWPAKEPSALGRVPSGPEPADQPARRARTAGGRPAPIPGIFLFGVKHALVKPAPILGAAPIPDAGQDPRPDGDA